MNAPQEPIRLPRGGLLFPTKAGWIQYGAVPETIKDTMVLPSGVASIFIVPPRLFSAQRGIALAEMEFPAYFNFFLKKQKTTVVCRPDQRERIERVMGVSLFGPSRLNDQEATARMPDLASEMAYFRRNPMKGGRPMELDDLFDFRELGDGGAARISDEVEVVFDGASFSVLEDGKTRWRWEGDPPLPERKPGPPGAFKAFRAPLLGVSVIGSGHGFDPANRTSGFIVWIQGRGVMVDPPVDWEDWIGGYDINPKQFDTLILTHCHADHDAGVLQKVLQEGRVTIYTTPSILDGFVTKYSALTGIAPDAFRDLFDHVPVRTGEPFYLNGAEAVFRYSLHSIPCMGFELTLRGKGLVYPSDTLNSPEAIHGLHEQGVISTERRDTLLQFPWHHELVLHEAGIPPIHTPVEALAKLGEEIKSRMRLVHVSAKAVPEGAGLQVAPTGLESTIDISPESLAVQEAIAMLDAMSKVEILAELPVQRAGEFLQMARRRTYEAGTPIIEAGSMGDEFFIILSGLAGVWVDGHERKTFGAFDYFGEHAILLGSRRTAGVIAKTDVELLVLTSHQFLHLIRDTEIAERLKRLIRQREQPSWELLSASPVFRDLTANQKNQLETVMYALDVGAGEQAGPDPLLVESGTVAAMAGERVVARLGRGQLAGDPARVMRGLPPRWRYVAETPVHGYAFEERGLRRFLRLNPGAYLELREACGE